VGIVFFGTIILGLYIKNRVEEIEEIGECNYFVLYRIAEMVTPKFAVDNEEEPEDSFQITQIHPILVSEYVHKNDLYSYVFKGFLSLLDDITLHCKVKANEYVFISANPLPENYQSGNEYNKLFMPFILNFQNSCAKKNKFTRFLVNSSESLIYLYTINSILDDVDIRVLIGTYSVPFP